jgi:uncharacterized membrane protein YhfC
MPHGPLLWLSLSATAILAGVAGLVLGLRRRGQVAWVVFALGAGAFVAAQLVHVPVLAALTLVAKGNTLAPGVKLTLNVIVLGGTAGLFEELARYAVLRNFRSRFPRWVDAVGFGIGHGGIEAVLLAVGMGIQRAFLLFKGDAILEQVQHTAPDKLPALQQQLHQLHTMGPLLAVLPVWERALAVLLHIALSIMVWKSVQQSRPALLVLAILWHAGIDGLAVLGASAHVAALTLELGFTALSLGSLAVVLRSRPGAGAEPAVS